MIDQATLTFVSNQLGQRFGLTLALNDRNEQRLNALARREGADNGAHYLEFARTREDAPYWQSLVDIAANGDTSFFNGRAMFERLASDILPDLLAKRPTPPRIWCAGIASGQEAYSLAMLIEEIRIGGGADLKIFATDLSAKQIDRAKSGCYTHFEVQRGLPIRKLIAHFEKDGELWRVSDSLAAMMRFAPHNLIDDSPSEALNEAPFDLVLCANVLRFLSEEAQIRALDNIAAACADDALLILADAERLPAKCTKFAQGKMRGVFTRTTSQAEDAAAA